MPVGLVTPLSFTEVPYAYDSFATPEASMGLVPASPRIRIVLKRCHGIVKGLVLLVYRSHGPLCESGLQQVKRAFDYLHL